MLYPVLTESRLLSDLSGVWDFKLDNEHGFEEEWYARPLEDKMTMPVPASYNDLKEGAVLRTLRDAQVGETVTVAKVHGAGAVKRRIMDMGITKNTMITVRKLAPLGDPLELTVRGYELSLRKADAEMVEIR